MTSRNARQRRKIKLDKRRSERKWLLRRFLSTDERPSITRRIEWGIFSVMCLLAVALNIVLYRHAGTFWRDEATTIQLAVAPQFSTMWAWLSRDSFPALFASLLRLWIIAGPGATDAGIRLFGTLVSLGVLVSLSAGCWMLAGRVPLLAMSLVAFNVDVFYFGSSLRGRMDWACCSSCSVTRLSGDSRATRRCEMSRRAWFWQC